MARVKIAGTSGASENTIVFSPAGGHSHNGRNSSLIDSTAYSMYDFSPTFVGTEVNPDRAVRQENNRIAFEDVIKRVVNNSVLAPAGIRLEQGSLNGSLIIANTITANQLAANTITADEIAAGTITATQLSSNIVLINNRITSQNWNGTIEANGTILSNNIGSAGWAITNTHAVFDSTLIRGSIAANSLVTPNLTISNTGAIISTNFNMTAGGNITANNATIVGSINAGSSITLGSPAQFSVNSSGSVTAKTGKIGPVNITTSSMNSQGSSPYLNTNSNYYNFDNFGDIYVYSNPGSDVGGPHVNQYHSTALVGEYIQIKKTSTSAFSDNLYEARIGDTTGTYAEVVVQNASTSSFVALYSTGNMTLTGSINGYGFTSGRHNGANQMVHTDGNGYLQVGYINSSNGNEGNNSNPSRVWGTNGSDDYLRSYLTSALSVGSAGYATSAGSASTADSAAAYTGSSISTGHGTFQVINGSNANLRAARPYVSGESLLAFYDNTVASAAAGGIRWGTSATDLVVWDVASDIRLKNNVRDFDDALDIFREVRPVKFNWKSNDAESHGFIAQELMEVYPLAVLEPSVDNEYYGVSTLKMVPLMAAVIKKMISKIDELEARIQTIEGV